MKKGLILILMVVFSIILLGCKSRIKALDAIDISLYDVLYEADDYTLYLVKEVSEVQFTVGIVVETLEDETCYLGITQQNAYIVLYNEKYYSLKSGVDLGLFHTDDLIDQGVLFQCHDNK